MKLFKKIEKRFKKSDSKSKLNKIIEELEAAESKVGKLLDEEKSDSKLDEYQKEYKAIKILLAKSRKQLEKS